MTVNTDTEFTHGRMGVSTRAIGTTVSSTARAFTDSLMALRGKESGRKARELLG